MRGIRKTIIGIISIVIMIVFTYVAYKLPILIGFRKLSKICGVIGFIISLRISMRLANLTE